MSSLSPKSSYRKRIRENLPEISQWAVETGANEHEQRIQEREEYHNSSRYLSAVEARRNLSRRLIIENPNIIEEQQNLFPRRNYVDPTQFYRGYRRIRNPNGTFSYRDLIFNRRVEEATSNYPYIDDFSSGEDIFIVPTEINPREGRRDRTLLRLQRFRNSVSNPNFVPLPNNEE